MSLRKPALRQSRTPGVTYVTGGIGEDEVRAFREVASNYNMRITLASKAGHYLSDVDVSITSGQRVVLSVRSAELIALLTALTQGLLDGNPSRSNRHGEKATHRASDIAGKRNIRRCRSKDGRDKHEGHPGNLSTARGDRGERSREADAMSARLSDLTNRISTMRQLGGVIGAMRAIAAARANEAQARLAGIRACAATVGEAIAKVLPVAPERAELDAIPPIRGARGRPLQRSKVIYADRDYDSDQHRQRLSNAASNR